MIVDFDDHENGHRFESDVCIVGGGAAAITIAREFFSTNISVVMLESGGTRWEVDTQELYRSEVVGVPHKGIHSGRARVLGGTTTLWAGQTLPLDEIDFARRLWVAHSGWPLERGELEPYYRRAEEILHLRPLDYEAREWPFPNQRPPAYDLALMRPVIAQFSPKPDFAAAYRGELSAATNVKVVLHANVVKLRTNDDASEAREVEIKSLTGKQGQAKARAYIICCGGIETPRLLLASDDSEKNGLGNRHDMVGRFFQDHLQAFLSPVRLNQPDAALVHFEPFYWRGIAYGPRAVLSASLQRQRSALNATLGLIRRGFAEENSATEAAKRIVKGIFQRFCQTSRSRSAQHDGKSNGGHRERLPKIRPAQTGLPDDGRSPCRYSVRMRTDAVQPRNAERGDRSAWDAANQTGLATDTVSDPYGGSRPRSIRKRIEAA